jgi:hypothetical protein
MTKAPSQKNKGAPLSLALQRLFPKFLSVLQGQLRFSR